MRSNKKIPQRSLLRKLRLQTMIDLLPGFAHGLKRLNKTTIWQHQELQPRKLYHSCILAYQPF